MWWDSVWTHPNTDSCSALMVDSAVPGDVVPGEVAPRPEPFGVPLRRDSLSPGHSRFLQSVTLLSCGCAIEW